MRHALFPSAGIRRHMGCRLPDAILHGKRSFRPRSRAVPCLAAAGFRVRLFSSLGLVVAPPAREPGQDTSAILRVLAVWLRVCHRFWRCVGPAPRVSPLNSQAIFASQASGAFFDIAGSAEGFHDSCQESVSFPIRALSLSGFRRVSLGGLREDRQSHSSRAGAR